MPLQNRVTPAGDIIACAARGTMFGNRGGRIHGPDRQLGTRRWHSTQWICCVLAFKGRHRQVMAPNRYTELFFLDEATALSAGHRPCFECRRAAAMEFATLWNAVRHLPGRAAAPVIDVQLHRERLTQDGSKRTWTAPCRELPDGTIVQLPQTIKSRAQPAILWHKRLHSWTAEGYGGAVNIAVDMVLEVLTPPSIVTVLGAGYLPVLHSSLLSACPRSFREMSCVKLE